MAIPTYPGILPTTAERPGVVDDTSQGYHRLADVLNAAYAQAAYGKGSKRHANGRAFTKQPIFTVTDLVGRGFLLGQAIKKAQEASGMLDRGQSTAAREELLGAINYLAAACIHIEDRDLSEPAEDPASTHVKDAR